jgi:hypothetical protein
MADRNRRGERVQIARSTTPDSDQVNMAFTFTEIGSPACDAADDAFNGFTVFLRPGSCGALVDDVELELLLNPWTVHTVNHQSYGIDPPPSPRFSRSLRKIRESCARSRIFSDLRAPEKIRFGHQQPIYARFSLLRIEPVPLARRAASRDPIFRGGVAKGFEALAIAIKRHFSVG